MRLDLFFTFVCQSIASFFRVSPALLYGLIVLFATAYALDSHTVFLLPLLLLSLPFLHRKIFSAWRIRLLLAIGLGIFAFAWIKAHTLVPTREVTEGIKGVAYIDIASLRLKNTSFGGRWEYKGVLQQFFSEGEKVIARNIPYTLSLSDKQILRPAADCSYRLAATLKQSVSGKYFLKVRKEEGWFPLSNSWSLAEYRFDAKQKLSSWIKEAIPATNAATFIAGIVTGEFDDSLMAFEFGRFGLQHIMAISGFHFAILTAMLSALLRPFLGLQWTAKLLLAALTLYFIFLGCSPSVMRAWLMAIVMLMGFLIGKEGSGLNTLGVALIAILLWDPFQCLGIGFQFSFATTAAILLFHKPLDLLLSHIFPKRDLSEVIQMNTLNQHGYCVLALFRKGLALTIAVNLIAAPLTLYYFHKFPILSIFYNLFFPFLVSISMLLLLMSCLCSVIPPLAALLHGSNSLFTQFVLNYTTQVPAKWDLVWRTHALTVEMIVCYGIALYLLGVLTHDRMKEEEVYSNI